MARETEQVSTETALRFGCRLRPQADLGQAWWSPTGRTCKTKGFGDKSLLGKATVVQYISLGQLLKQKFKSHWKGASFSVFMSITLISVHLSLGQGRYQVFPGTFIPVFTSRVKRIQVITNYSGNSDFFSPDPASEGAGKKGPFPSAVAVTSIINKCYWLHFQCLRKGFALDLVGQWNLISHWLLKEFTDE